jgi:hypothetical protein
LASGSNLDASLDVNKDPRGELKIDTSTLKRVGKLRNLIENMPDDKLKRELGQKGSDDKGKHGLHWLNRELTGHFAAEVSEENGGLGKMRLLYKWDKNGITLVGLVDYHNDKQNNVINTSEWTRIPVKERNNFLKTINEKGTAIGVRKTGERNTSLRG